MPVDFVVGLVFGGVDAEAAEHLRLRARELGVYRVVKDRDLPASELLQSAVREEVRRQQLREEADRYVAELIDEVGPPSAKAVARAEALSRRIRRETSSSRSA